jgi:DNA-directed RNA polymerase subunit RPC12/RpoP
MPDKNDILICKFCGSDNVIKKKQAGYAVLISILLFGLPLPFFKKTYYCFDCNKEWKIEKNAL